MPRTSFQTVDEYIASFPPDTQEKLELLRQTIIGAAPGAEEKISYDMPGYALNGSLVYFAGYKNHIGLYGGGASVERFPGEVTPYITGKGTLRFELKDPLPIELIARIVEFRVQQNLAKATAKPAKAKTTHQSASDRGKNARLR